jgi:BirA family biotin operon repressor/biotin-[acetyl-CoA-carboxylase] ligase
MIGLWTSDWLKAAGHWVQFSDSVASTNGLAKEGAMQEVEPVTFYVTNHQTAGRGQGDHRWINAAAGTNLLLTCSFATSRPTQPELCLQLGKELGAACREVWPDLNWQVKAPNDLLLDDEKVADSNSNIKKKIFHGF